jgi:hypothetical protein
VLVDYKGLDQRAGVMLLLEAAKRAISRLVTRMAVSDRGIEHQRENRTLEPEDPAIPKFIPFLFSVFCVLGGHI